MDILKKWLAGTRTLVKSAYQNKNSYFSTKTYVVGTQKNRLNETVLYDVGTQSNRLNETVLFSIHNICKLEDLKVRRPSPDLLNNVKIGQGQLQLIMEQIWFYHIWGLQPFWSSDLNNLMNNPSNSPVISEKKMLR